jgi:hypothetical protein
MSLLASIRRPEHGHYFSAVLYLLAPGHVFYDLIDHS